MERAGASRLERLRWSGAAGGGAAPRAGGGAGSGAGAGPDGPAGSAEPSDRCAICGLGLGEAHPHLFERGTRRVECSCLACALLFERAGARYARIPRDTRRLAGFALPEAAWAGLGIPVELAFLRYDTLGGEARATYPSPAGAVTAAVEAEAWERVRGLDRRIGAMAPDVEALLVNRLGAAQAGLGAGFGGGGNGCWIVPLDRAYRLVGVVRAEWRGMGGGAGVRRRIAAECAALEREARA